MSFLVVLIADRWGTELGGINVFNTGLAKGISEALQNEGTCICFIESLSENLSEEIEKPNLLLQSYKTIQDIAKGISHLFLENTSKKLKEILVIGHDVKSGKVAIEVVNLLRLHVEVNCRSAVVIHMDYSQYTQHKSGSYSKASDASRSQRDIFSTSDYTFSVGPLLERSFNFVREGSKSIKNRDILQLIPGSPQIENTQPDYQAPLKFFISGRLGEEDDRIKNLRLSIGGIKEAYRQGRLQAANERWNLRGTLYAFGINDETDKIFIEKTNSSIEGTFSIIGVPYKDSQKEIFEQLSICNIALMPSYHEGFGLAGWEALCAGTPLICSSQSGLAVFLRNVQSEYSLTDLPNVEFVDVVGKDRENNLIENDIKIIAEAIIRIERNYKARKEAALRFSNLLREKYTWKKCAIDIFNYIKWPTSRATRWEGRKEAAESSSALENKRTIDLAITYAKDGKILAEWSSIDTALDIISNYSRTEYDKKYTIIVKSEILDKLSTLGDFIDKFVYKFINNNPKRGKTRNTALIQILWRYMAAASSASSSFDEFITLLRSSIYHEVKSDSFLRREFFYYSCKFYLEFPERSQAIAKSEFSDFFTNLANDPLLQTRIARLSSIYPNMRMVIDISPDHIHYWEEYERCQNLEQYPWKISEYIELDPRNACSMLALSTLRYYSKSSGIEHIVQLFSKYYESKPPYSWRGDKRFNAAILTVMISHEATLRLFETMANDEDEAIRWAAVDLIFSKPIQNRLAETLVKNNFGSSHLSLFRKLGSIVDQAVSFDNYHPWLQREFLTLLADDVETRVADKVIPVTFENGNSNRRIVFTLEDFPKCRNLIGASVFDNQEDYVDSAHPEVLLAKERVKKVIKRILLVLPPISIRKVEDYSISKTTSPPLGIGYIASYLAFRGHDVQVVDCHRFPNLLDKFIGQVSSFDVVGFNVVQSTTRSTYEIISKIKRIDSRVAVAIGGPAANLNTWEFSALTEEEQNSWDFEISSNPELNLEMILAAMDVGQFASSGSGIRFNPKSQLIQSIGIQDNAKVSDNVENSLEWVPLTALDRRIFRNGNFQYEPTTTRSITRDFFTEIHVAMSKGCDWSCSFCTERSMLSKGEVRRPFKDVLNEIELQCLIYHNVNIQFVDDNLLPQIASPRYKKATDRALAVEWSEEFLNGLIQLKHNTQSSFGWRGIFRLEDFIEYESAFKSIDFISLLVKSGCRMLAFGIEHGDESTRNRLKLSNGISNKSIVDLFSRLSNSGILTKAYFILGGPHEVEDSISATVNFALECGCSIAYFSIYKHFTQAVGYLRTAPLRGSQEKHSKYLTFKELLPDWDRVLSDSIGNPNQFVFSESIPTYIDSAKAMKMIGVYERLYSLGFRFSDLVKYNDYHNDEGPSAELFNKMSFNDREGYFRSFNTAFMSFYLRDEFVEVYANLIKNAY